jgi:hypothetical protein
MKAMKDKHFNSRDPDLNAKSNPKRWLEENPIAREYFLEALSLLRSYYIDSYHGYINQANAPEYRFNSHGDGYTTIIGAKKHVTVRFEISSKVVRKALHAEHCGARKKRHGTAEYVQFIINDKNKLSALDDFLIGHAHKIKNFTGSGPKKIVTALDSVNQNLAAEDAKYYSEVANDSMPGKFIFGSGHNPKAEEAAKVNLAVSDYVKAQLHNRMQTKLYKQLCSEIGKKFVGTEIPAGNGRLIDLVTQRDAKYQFYEIKTAITAQACIRQALSQLLEYAYWRKDEVAISELIIVGPVEITSHAKMYLDKLRRNFNLPLSYIHLSPE